ILACFCLRLYKTVNVGDLKYLLKYGESDNSVLVGSERLKDKALTTFSEASIFGNRTMISLLGSLPSKILAREFFCRKTCNIEIAIGQNGKTLGLSDGSRCYNFMNTKLSNLTGVIYLPFLLLLLQYLVNLKELHLTHSNKLKELLDLSKATNLLTSVHSYIFCLAKLEKLDLADCQSLTIPASEFHLCSLVVSTFLLAIIL
ncbi:hypothetical protein CR513_35325, partial [Mucuna pruriens]